MTRWFLGLAVVGLSACASTAPDSGSVTEALSPGRYQLTAPLVECPPEGCPHNGCPAVSMSTVEVGPKGDALVDPCPRGWSCAHDRTLPLGELYSPTLPKSGGVVCSYDVTVGEFEAEQ